MRLFGYTQIWGLMALVMALSLAVLMAAACNPAAGGRLVFVSMVGGDPEIVVVDAKTGEASAITDNRSRDLSPQWSPDGKKIVYMSDQAGDMEINVVDPDGKSIERLTHNGGDDRFPRWSPDGKRLAFISEQEGTPEVYLMGADGGPVTRITSNGTPDLLGDWSPNGEWLVYYSEGAIEERGLWLRNPDGVNLVRMTTGQDRDPVWSPDGKHIAFVRWDGGNADLFVMRKLADGTWQDGVEITRLTQHEADDVSPNWSPDARKIAFVSYRDGSAEIYSMRVDGSKQRRLTKNEADDLAPDWSSDGSRIAFVSSLYGQSEIFVMNADGSQQRRLTNNTAEDHSPNW
ncbi:MAG: hypothetical protein BZY80_01760 [SAR202 cluster bacterium Io17-Chloro-G2]|nr:MAG: hypothetical protein BZY80_01760 [SAR202 cluster bacterium Io17-Chloro-G2]